ncbi:TetR/AcrR family transcriptional regulator [Stakelama tenebrarum]|uniref:TetR/AcrR family transcriptional regulator n=1 Tax=Stakelama tenebrarum TaxID=2711215 RepID=A0A6G6Y798_9SPHN|nr:TetR/AcrR family transcriptional regulator [Sphingosinithalassobacter tenebrarum]QIG80790.1 TetR/AcrR family transcriptional regulator [Sphingosinithalassobacter tenebrarum]
MDASPFRSPQERQAERESKREAVLLAAVRMFNAHGFHATSLDDVAASLGVSKPTIYHYLGNKDQVLFECVRRGMNELREAADRAHATDGTGLDRLRMFLNLYAQISMTEFGRCVNRTMDEALTPESARRFRALKREVDLAMRALIEEGIADESIAPCDVRMTAFTLAGALNWPARWYRPEGEDQPEAIAATMVDVLTNGLAPR